MSRRMCRAAGESDCPGVVHPRRAARRAFARYCKSCKEGSAAAENVQLETQLRSDLLLRLCTLDAHLGIAAAPYVCGDQLSVCDAFLIPVLYHIQVAGAAFKVHARAPRCSALPRRALPRGALPRGALPRGALPRGAMPRGASMRKSTPARRRPLSSSPALVVARSQGARSPGAPRHDSRCVTIAGLPHPRAV